MSGNGVPEDQAVAKIRLIGFPLRVAARAQQHFDELVRELTLIGLQRDEGGRERHPLPGRLIELVDALGRRYATSTDSVTAERDAALARGLVTIDMTYEIPSQSAAQDAEQLGQILDEADEFCRGEHLLTLETPPDGVAFRRWYIQEFVRQSRGEPPRPWTGPVE